MKIILRCLLCLSSFLPAICSNVHAGVDFNSHISSSLIHEITENDLKKIESSILENARPQLKLENLGREDCAKFFIALLSIYEKKDDAANLNRTIADIKKNYLDTVRFDGTEKAFDAGLALVKLYISAYRVGKEEIFKNNAAALLREIENTYFDRKLNAFLVKTDGNLAATAGGNALAAAVFFEASREFKEGSFQEIAKHCLTFLINNLIKNNGAFHIFDINASMASMDGQLIDNAVSGIALIEGYRILKDERYIILAKNIAEFMLERLYDEKFGGFILRNSDFPENYAEGQELYIGDKPFEENSLAGYFFESLYETTGNNKYRSIAKGTLGYLFSSVKDTPPQEQAYFITAVYNYIKPDAIAKKERWVGKPDALQSEWKPKVPETGILPLAILSFLAGLLSFLSPCTLPILPAYFAFTFQGEKSRIMAMTFLFFLGLASVFSLMGATASFIGSFLKTHISAITAAGGILLIIFGFMSIIGKGFSGAKIFKTAPSATLGGSFIFGATMAFGWTACVGPILAGILVLAATEDGVLKGVGLLFVYALGLSLPLMLLSLFFKNMNRDGLFWRFIKGRGWEVNLWGRIFLFHSTSMISGVVFVSLGVLMVSGYLAYINLLLPLSTQLWFVDIEERLLEMFK